MRSIKNNRTEFEIKILNVLIQINLFLVYVGSELLNVVMMELLYKT